MSLQRMSARNFAGKVFEFFRSLSLWLLDNSTRLLWDLFCFFHQIPVMVFIAGQAEAGQRTQPSPCAVREEDRRKATGASSFRIHRVSSVQVDYIKRVHDTSGQIFHSEIKPKMVAIWIDVSVKYEVVFTWRSLHDPTQIAALETRFKR